MTPQQPNKNCPVCDDNFSGTSRQVYCSQKCRRVAASEKQKPKRKAKQKKARALLSCKSCGMSLIDVPRARAFCSRKCYTDFYNKRAKDLGYPSVPKDSVSRYFLGIFRRHSITKDAWLELFEKQEKRCANQSCQNVYPVGDSKWHIDHDHKCCPTKNGTSCGKCVRGILCHYCNVAAGHMNDDPNGMRGLADYLERVSVARL